MTRFLGLLSLLLLGVLAAPTTAVAAPPQATNFVAHLSGGNETPPNDSRAQGELIMHLNSDGTMSFKLIVANIQDVFAAHIHLAPPGVAGPIVVPLFQRPPLNGQPNPIPGRTDGILAQGTFSAANFGDGLLGRPMSALVDAILAGDAYANVHTFPAHPGGEIRGQIMAAGPA
jgi:hypothetical protein